jgi:3-deoxy-D-manno-octulosonate 8-phosphate phosphatase (KDO 8-P phosphatase)
VDTYLFDWDGVFNTGTKGGGRVSGFSEPDSMGTNLLRFGHWLRTGHLPRTGIVTAADNPAALAFAQREHFDVVYAGILHKQAALNHLETDWHVAPARVAWFFDDVLDLALAAVCGLRILIRCKASPGFTAYVLEKGLCDYRTGNQGGRGGVREACELLLELRSQLVPAIEGRVRFEGDYQTYLQQRNLVKTRVLTAEDLPGDAL